MLCTLWQSISRSKRLKSVLQSRFLIVLGEHITKGGADSVQTRKGELNANMMLAVEDKSRCTSSVMNIL